MALPPGTRSSVDGAAAGKQAEVDRQSLLPEIIEGELVGQELLVRERHVAERLVAAAQKGGEHGGAAGVETAMAPALVACYGIPFLIHFLWGFVLTLLSLVGAGLYGLRRLWHWLCGGR